jgi:hypothetical protein
MLNLNLQLILLALYVGPDQLVPLASLFALISGAVLTFWRRIVGVARRVHALFGKR